MERLPGTFPAAGQENCAGGLGRHNFCPVAIRKGRGGTEGNKRKPHALKENSPLFSLVC